MSTLKTQFDLKWGVMLNYLEDRQEFDGIINRKQKFIRSVEINDIRENGDSQNFKQESVEF